MRYLIDTQILIWFQLNDQQLSPWLYDILVNEENQILVSQISLFEIAIKQKTGKLPQFPVSIMDIMFVMNQDVFTLLPVKVEHIVAYEQIPLLQNHRDPFDRLLIATALSENIPIISVDEKFRLYIPQVQVIAE